ncbi:unnamed protein product [Sphenostylis stenocarpa]|uniref:Rhodanese domain-containing protein n=1 Tax=Sphenostylis stenocarpa TaxID=92480 RepID=A0AA86S0Z5_9FABA|nr:unnamed protein product [Sphenostylis stenocarpa]
MYQQHKHPDTELLWDLNMTFSVALLPRWSVFLLLLLVLCRSGAKVVTIDARAANDLIQTGSIYLDVRTVEEFQKGHVDADNIVNIPYMLNTPNGKVRNPDFLKEVSLACNKEDNLIVGCQIGVRSSSATVDLLSDGFKNVKDMEGGYEEWVINKFPVKISLAKEEL